MLDFSLIAAEALAAKGKRISFNHNSVFAGMEMSNNQEDVSLIINQIAMGTNNRLNIIKNVIMPFVKNYKNLVNTKIATVETVSKLSKYSIIEQDTPDIIDELKAKGIVNLNVTNVDIGVTSVVVPAPLEDIRSFVTFNNTVLNQLLTPHLARMEDKDIISLWDKVLGSISNSNQYIIRLSNNSISKLDELLVLFAIVTNIKTVKQAGVRVSEGSYLTTMDLLHKHLSDILNRVNDRITLDEKYDKLVIGATEKEVTVHSKLYNKFLETHEPEVLLGLLYSGDADRVSTSTAIMVDSDKYVKVWDNAIKRENFRQMSEGPARYRTIYAMCLDELYTEFDADEAIAPHVRYTLTNAKRVLENILDASSDKYQAEKLLDVDFMVREIAGKVIFRGTMLDSFLESMYTYHTLNSKLTVEELTTMSTIDMIIDYLFSQLTIENV